MKPRPSGKLTPCWAGPSDSLFTAASPRNLSGMNTERNATRHWARMQEIGVGFPGRVSTTRMQQRFLCHTSVTVSFFRLDGQNILCYNPSVRERFGILTASITLNIV